MKLTVGQLLVLVRGRLVAAPDGLAKNQSLRNLAQLERNANAYLGYLIDLPLPEPSKDFGKRSQEPSEPEVEEEDVEDVPETPPVEEKPKRTYKRRSYSSDEDSEV